MDRCALFVDASYALADGALAVHGTRNRDSVSWDYAGLLKLLGSLSRDRTGLPLLRCYWYDTVADGSRATEHDTLADIPGVKLRLSKARPSRKEGVEAEIRKDLTALARNRAVSDVIIVSAEEDLGPVIAEVQDLGIRTILLHIGTDGNWAMSRSLRQECDDVIEIAPGHLRPYVDLISGAEPQLASNGHRELAASTAQPSQVPTAIEAPAMRLYAPTVAAEYEHAGLLTSSGNGQSRDQREVAQAPDASRFGSTLVGGHSEVLDSSAAQRSPENQSSQDQQLQTAGLARAQALQAEAVQAQAPTVMPPQAQAQQTLAQQPQAQQAPAQQTLAQQPQALHAQAQQPQPAPTQQYEQTDLGRAQAASSANAGLGQGGFAGQDLSRGQNGQLSHQLETGFNQRSVGDDGRGRAGSLPGVAGGGQSVMHGQTGLGQNDAAHSGLTQNGLTQNGLDAERAHAERAYSERGHAERLRAGRRGSSGPRAERLRAGWR